jgi:hypothetical protein
MPAVPMLVEVFCLLFLPILLDLEELFGIVFVVFSHSL